jgi:hypothetical protein
VKPPGAKSSASARAALWYVLASSYLVAFLLLHRALTGIWGVSRELIALLIAVPSAQTLVLKLLRPRAPDPGGAHEDESDS